MSMPRDLDQCDLLSRAYRVIEGLRDQQAMPDDKFDPVVEQVLKDIKEWLPKGFLTEKPPK